ncbi:hypothetical protein [Pseudomonas sp. Q1-7]|uniref:hypothetical protein n=1 Tax=Pseudomonas sp. Q1-7 TaxID=3020843 RepID=UPI002300302D|nr:hypothetical protein [Pseudomonas sp. Q1-7]
MNSFTSIVLMWLFGRWIFNGGSVTSDINALDVTPLTIFASYFATAGVALFSVLSSWAVFLGIFRLRNGGNFFGVRDANESFFYPLRVTFALALLAPIIPVGSAGDRDIVLTPGHSLVAGVAKSAAEFGDAAQADSFQLMHTYNLFHDPQFHIDVDPARSLEMLNSWKLSATQLATAVVFRDPQGVYSETSAEQIAQDVLLERWNQVHRETPSEIVGAIPSPRAVFLAHHMRSIPVPLIAPSDAAARASTSGVKGLIGFDAENITVDRERTGEGWFCQAGWMESTLCSDEFLAVRKNNASSIQVGIAAAQRHIWVSLFSLALAQAIEVREGSASAEESKRFYDDGVRWANQTANWFAETVELTVANQLATDQALRSEAYFNELRHWGWMLGGTFVLRAASDFSRAAAYAEGATSQMMPQSSLAAMTPGDDLSKLVEGQALSQIQPDSSRAEQSWLSRIFSLDILKETAGPGSQNIHTFAAWGRAMVGSGIGLIAGGSVMSYLPWIKKVSDGSLMKVVGYALIISGGLLGYVMPLLFAVYGLMGAISWLVVVASTFFGVTLWSAGMAAPKGEEHTSQLSAKGWNSFIFIGLYPALSVGGLAAAIVISAVGLSLVQMLAMGLWGMFDPGVSEVGRPLESLGGLVIGGLLTLGVVIMLSWNVVVTSAQLVTNFPRSVLNMISLSEPGLNPYENSMHGILGNVSMVTRTAIGGVVRNIMRPGRGIPSATGQ